eukprot:9471243-Pyramimonas_sp.AAC.1
MNAAYPTIAQPMRRRHRSGPRAAASTRAASRHSPRPQRNVQLLSGRAVDDPLTTRMIQPAGMIAAIGHGGVELALLDSGSGVVACP